jgi:two-component system response regulator VicR
MMKKVLVIEDEKSISDIVKLNLQKEGYEVITAYDGEEGLNKALNLNPDLILLDVMLPKKDGFSVLRALRAVNKIPIIMLTAKEEEVDKVLGLEMGADDYITKPFGMRELLARVKVSLRRIEDTIELSHKLDDVLISGEVEIDFIKYEVRKRTDVIDFTKREFELIKFLALQANQVFSREQLLKDVWGYEYFGDIRTVDVTMRRMREKLEDDSSNPHYLMTKRGVGYYFKK